MNKVIFRKVSLDRLSSPEDLDQLITVTRPRGWIALFGLICILIVGIVWGFVGSIPTKVTGMGMITASEGVANVIHPVSGKVSDVSVRSGDYVRKGDVIARIEQRDIVDEINTLKKDIELASYFNVDIYDARGMELSPNLSNLYDIAARINQSRELVNIEQANQIIMVEQNLLDYSQAELILQQHQFNASIAEENLRVLNALFKEGAIPRKEYDDAVNRVELANMQVVIAREELLKLQFNIPITSEALNLDFLREQFENTKGVIISELTSRLNKAEDELRASSSIISQVEGRILQVNIEKGDIVQVGIPVATIIKEDQTVNSLEFVLYVSPEEGKKVIPGMDVHVSPTIIKKEDYGYMLGKVMSVSEYPVSVQGLVQTLGSQELANLFAGGSAPIEVRVNLTPDSSTYSGFKWSTAQGPPVKIDSGNISTGSIVIENRRPIEMVIPYSTRVLD